MTDCRCIECVPDSRQCPCGAPVVIDSVTPDYAGWNAHCQAGHKLYMQDLDGQPVLLEDEE